MRYNHFDMLPERAFLKVGGRITLEGGGGSGGGGNQQSTQTSYQTNIPAYLEEPAKRMVARGETLSEQAYEPYKGARVSGFTPEQMAAFREVGGLTTPGQFGEAGAAVTGAERFGTAGAMGAMGYAPEMFSADAAKAYMSPYQQAVTDIAKREATTEAAGLNRELAAKAAKAGAFGGSRFGIEQALLGSKLATNLSDIQTKGSQAAFENAQQQFERDRAARLAGAKFGLEGAQFGADVGLKSAAQLGQLGTAEQEADLKRIAAQQSAGAQQQALEQQKLDTAYQQAMEQRDWEKNQLGFLSGLIRGTPFSTSQLQSTSAPGATAASQLASIGLGAYGLSSLLGKKDGGAIKMADGGSVEGYAYGGDIKGLTDQQLQEALSGKSDVVSPEDAKQELSRRAKLRTAVQGVRAEEQLASGIGSLEADNMEFADGGILGYAEGGDVAHFAVGGVPKWEDVLAAEQRWKDSQTPWYLPTPAADPSKGAMLEYQKIRSAYESKKPVDYLPPLPKAEGLAPAQPAAPAAKKDEAPATPAGPARPPKTYAPVSPGTPAAQIESPFQKMIMEKMAQTDKSNAAMADDLARGQKDVDAIRSDIKGIAALRAAAAIAQGGPGGSLGQIGRGLGAAGEEAQRGVNLMQSARQGLMGQRLQMAQLERAANAGDITALATLEQLRQQGPLWAAQAKFFNERDRGSSGSAAGARDISGALNNIKASIKAVNEDRTMPPAAKQVKLAELYSAQNELLSKSLNRVGIDAGGGTAPKGAEQYVR